MGVVYLASDPVIGRRIALKVLRLDLPGAADSSERLRSRFRREAQSAGILSHPNIVTVYDAIEETDDGALCIAMEYVEGTNLSDVLLRAEPLAPDFALDVAAQIAEALGYAHQRGVIHRDVKPANVIVTPSGRVKITDFGIAHLIDSALSDDLRFLGTPSYMAPERIEGCEIDQRADLFSLGVVLYQLVTRHMPFKGSSVADLTRSIARDPPTPPEHYAPDISPELREILMRSLAKDPDKRYQRAGEMAADLRAVLSRTAALHQTQPIPSGESGSAAAVVSTGAAPPAVAGGGVARGTLWLAAAGVGAIAVVVGALFWLLAPAPEQAGSSEPVPEAGRVPAYRALMSQGVGLLAVGEVEAAHELLRSAVLLGPESESAARWRELAEIRMDRDRQARREIDTVAAVELGRVALSRGRLTEALSALEMARLHDPDHAAVADLESRVWLAQQPARLLEPEPEALAARPPPPVRIEPEVIPLERVPVSTRSTVQIDFFSQVSRGVLMIYDGERQIYKEPFRFVERRRFRKPKPATGSLSGSLEMPSGALAWRVYLSLQGEETQVLPVSGELRGGATHVLRLRVAGDGSLTATLR